MSFDQRHHVVDEGAYRGDHQAPEPTVDPGGLAGTFDPLPVGEHLDHPRAADLDATGSERRNAGVDLAVDGLHEDGGTVGGLDLGCRLPPGDDEDLADPQQVRITDPVGTHELVDRAIEALRYLPEGVARLHDDGPGPLGRERLSPDLREFHAFVDVLP